MKIIKKYLDKFLLLRGIIGAFLCSCFLSCVYSKITHLTDDDLLLLQVYEEGDTILFQSSDNITDTLIVTKKSIHNSVSPFRTNEASSLYIANGSIAYKLIHQNDIFEGILMLIEKDNEDSPVSISFSFCGLYSESIKADTKNLIVNGETEDDCIIINNTIAHQGENQKNMGIKEIVWSKSKGIIRYDTKEESYICISNKAN